MAVALLLVNGHAVHYTASLPEVELHRFFLPRDAMRKRSLCGGQVSVRLFVCSSRSCIVSRRLKISSNFFIGLVAQSFQFVLLYAPIPNSKGTLSATAQSIHGGGKILRFSTEITVYLANRKR